MTDIRIERMMIFEKIYNKLVRDKISEIIAANNQSCKTEILTEERFAEMLDKKLVEECGEYQADKSVEELADILEVYMR